MKVWRFCRAKCSALDPILAACAALLSIISLMVILGGASTFGKRVVVMQIAATLVGWVAILK